MELLKQTSTLSLQQKNFTAVPSSRHSMFATAASEYWESQKTIRKREKKQQNNVKTFILASNWINTHVYMNCLIGENFVTLIQIKHQERQNVLNTFAPSRDNSETLTWEKFFLKWRQLCKDQWPTEEKLLPSNAAGGMVQPVIFCAGSIRKYDMEL